MKIIDEKGRLFGKINIIDFLVILFLISLTPMFYFGYKIFSKKPGVNNTVQASPIHIEIEFKAVFRKIKSEDLKLISIGDREVDVDGKVIAEIINLGKPSPQTYEIDIGNNMILVKNDPLLKELPVTLRTNAELRQNAVYYKDKQIVYNSSIDFVTDKYRMEAVILSPFIADKEKLEFTKETQQNIENKILSIENKITNIENMIDGIRSAISILRDKTNRIESETAPINKRKRR